MFYFNFKYFTKEHTHTHTHTHTHFGWTGHRTGFTRWNTRH